jgi:hypothetical protein
MRLPVALASLCALFLTSPTFAQEVPPRDGMRLDPTSGLEIGKIYQAWMTPDQEGGEEEDTPAMIPKMFKSFGLNNRIRLRLQVSAPVLSRKVPTGSLR